MSTTIIYFLVNNDYQYLEAKRLACELHAAGRRTALIAIPHTLTLTLDSVLFDPIITLPTPARLPWLGAWLQYLGARNRLRSALPATSNDTLILFTEFELLNQLAAIIFKERRGSVNLIEDGGVGTYIPLTLKNHEQYNWKNRVMKAMIRMIPGLNRTHFTKFDGILFPMLEDTFLDGICLYRRMTIARTVPVKILSRPPLATVQTRKGRVVFLNQPLYSEHIQTEANYLAGLREILGALCAGFVDVLFKFHPREPFEARARITSQILDTFPKLRVVEGNQPFETLLADLRPEAVASYNSTPLLNMTGTGVQPLFVYHLLQDLRQAPSFVALHTLLEGWGYQFAQDWRSIASGYQAGERFNDIQSGMRIAQLLEQHISLSEIDTQAN